MATAASAWAKPGSWARESEQQTPIESTHKTDSDPSPDFPSLAAAAAAKSSKKKKPQPQSLAEFARGKPAEFPNLPTGPRERGADELDRPPRGFGYSRNDSRDETRRGGSGRDETRGVSRADEADDWGSMKKPVGGYERREKGGFFDSQSRADEVDSWVSKRSERRVFDGWGRRKEEALRADLDTWGRKREEVGGGGGGGGGRPRLVLQPRTLPMANGGLEGSCEGEKGKGSNLFGFARPREEVLAEKGRDWKKIDERMEEGKVKERVVDGGLSEDRTERSWRKEVASDAVASMYGFFFVPCYVW